MSPTTVLLLAMVLGHAFGSASAILATTPGPARRLAGLGAVVGAGAGLVLGLDTLIWGTPLRVELPWLLGLAGGVSLQLDRLGALFLVIVEVVAVPAALYGVAYARVYEGTSSSLRQLGAMWNVFLLAMALVPLGIVAPLLEVRAVVFLGFWFVQQFLLGALGLAAPGEEGGGVAWWAHIGGFAAGLVLVRLFRRAGGRRAPRTWRIPRLLRASDRSGLF